MFTISAQLFVVAALITVAFLVFYLILRLKDVSRTVEALNQRLPVTEDMRKHSQDVIAHLNREIGSLNQKAQEISAVKSEVAALKNLFTVPKKAGLAGEKLLEKMLGDVLGRDMFETQYKLSSGTVDFVIKFRGSCVPMDSKLPLENFRKILESSDQSAKRSYWKSFSGDVKRRIDETSKYILPGEGTTDFAFMYIPSESVYYEAFIKDTQFGEENRLPDYALKKKVSPVSPQTIYPYLIIILQGMKALKIEDNAKEIVDKVAGLKNEFGRFNDIYNVIIGHLLDAHKKHVNEGAPKLSALRKNLENLENRTHL